MSFRSPSALLRSRALSGVKNEDPKERRICRRSIRYRIVVFGLQVVLFETGGAP